MVTINLLPWREDLRELKQKQFIRIVVTILLVITVVTLLLYQYFQYRIDQYQTHTSLLKQQLAQLSPRIKNVTSINAQINHLTTWLTLINNMHIKNAQLVSMFNKLINSATYNMQITELQFIDKQLLLTGYIDNKKLLEEFIRHLNGMTGIQGTTLTDFKVIEVNTKLICSFAITALFL